MTARFLQCIASATASRCRPTELQLRDTTRDRAAWRKALSGREQEAVGSLWASRQEALRTRVCPTATGAHSAQVQPGPSLHHGSANWFFSEGLPWFILPWPTWAKAFGWGRWDPADSTLTVSSFLQGQQQHITKPAGDKRSDDGKPVHAQPE